MTTTEPQSIKRTKHVRVSEDLAEKLGEIHDVTDCNIAEVLDPLIRVEIDNLHRTHSQAIQIMRTARERAKKLRDEVPEMANDLGGESGGG